MDDFDEDAIKDRELSRGGIVRGRRHAIQVIGFLWSNLIDGRFPSMFDVWIDRVAHFHVESTPEAWKPYVREKHTVKDEWVDLAGSFIEAWYQ